MRKFKKLTSIFLAALLATSVTAVSLESVSAVVDENGCYAPGDNIEATHRYYFAMPNSWLNEYTDTAGVYWWSGTDACGAIDGTGGTVTWPGYMAQRDDFATEYYGIYYIDCPTDVPTIVWNNYIDGGSDKYAPVYSAAKQAQDANVEFFCDGDSDIYGTEWFAEMEESYNGDKAKLGDFADNFFYDEQWGLGFAFDFDNMIYVAPYEPNGENFMGKPTYSGDWYFYYGNGEYGTYPTREEAESKGALKNLADSPATPDEPVPVDPTEPATPDEPFVPVYPDDDEGQIHFDVKKSGWDLNTNKKFYCHIWKYDGSPTSSGTDWLQWQSKKEQCSFDADTGIASFDLKKTGHNFDVSDGAVYCVIFSSNTGRQTYNTIMSGACIGDTMYCTGMQVENPEDSEMKCSEAVWKNNPDCGPEKKITSSGKVVGSALPEGVTDEMIVARYLIEYYNDSEIVDKTQEILNELEVSPAGVMDAVIQCTDDEDIMYAVDDILSACDDPTVKYCDGYYYGLYGDSTAVITGYDGNETQLVIPSELDGHEVREIGEFAFEFCEDIVSITIPDSVMFIGDFAFTYCTSLESVTLSDSVISIGEFAFFESPKLKSITIPLSVSEIGGNAFGYYISEDEEAEIYGKVEGFTIRGFRESAAESYANDNGFEFEAIGDIDDNGVISISDATLIQKYLADLTGLTPEQIKAADVNGDGVVNVHDATAIQLLLVS